MLALALVWQATDAASTQVVFLDYHLEPVRSDRLGQLFATIFCIMAFAVRISFAIFLTSSAESRVERVSKLSTWN